MTAAENRLIAALPRKDRLTLLAQSQSFPLALSAVLSEASTPTRHVYFPIHGFISLVRPVDGRLGLEVGMVGSEGMLGAQLALGVPISPLRALVQGEGVALRIEARAFRAALAASPALQRTMQRYIYVLMQQCATSAACLRFHPLGSRLARWLLMSQDRAQADSFYVTQEFLACMLGVRRVGVTGAASGLQRDGVIEYSRGKMAVLNRSGLEEAACSCYRADREVYTQILFKPASLASASAA